MSAPARPVPERAYAAALASVRGIGPKRLRRLLEGMTPPEAWGTVLRGHPDDVDFGWRSQARHMDVQSVWDAHQQNDVDVLLLGDGAYPAALGSDPEAPSALFYHGDPSVIDRHPIATIVGTRSATRYGLGVAAQLGADLAATGVTVVSGLALGIDGAAHEGSCAGWQAGAPDSAPPVAVVAGGLHDPYPRRHVRLWQRVADAGVILSESPVGVAPERWRFPQRNRVLAAISDVVIVVECHMKGGSLLTVQAAWERGVPVGAVPGSIRSPASAGTNALLADGCFPVRDVTDVLVAIDLTRRCALAAATRQGRATPKRGVLVWGRPGGGFGGCGGPEPRSDGRGPARIGCGCRPCRPRRARLGAVLVRAGRAKDRAHLGGDEREPRAPGRARRGHR